MSRRIAEGVFPMGTISKPILVLGAAVSLFAATAYTQDSPSLGDLARQQRQQKQSKAAQGKDAKTPKVITNEELPQHADPAPAVTSASEESGASAQAPSGGAKQPAEQVKAQIQAQKSQISSLQKQMDEVDESIRFAPGNCVSNCEQWNQQQQEKQQQVAQMKTQLDEQKKRLEEMQDSARKQGYGSSVYDP
jgi:predicted RNase H-like nuclease (RuvC/YqgF family)